MIKVTKFGGSSLCDSNQFKKVKDIVLSDVNRKVVVVSALGKRNSDDTKITDLLYLLHAHLLYNAPIDEIWSEFESRFINIKEELDIEYNIKNDIDELYKELNKNISQDYLVSRGEYLTAKLMSSFLGYEFIDAKDLIIFDMDGSVCDLITNDNIKNRFNNTGIVVPGFYGSYKDGNIKLLSRGGSDVTGSILAKALNASLYENWTDVSGIMMADPRIVDNPKVVSEISYHELRELSYMGANVLHEETIFPVQALNIPINLKNTNRPNDKGTMIYDKAESNFPITGIAGKKGFISYSIYNRHLSSEIGFMRKVLEIFERNNVSIEHVPTGIDNISVVVSLDEVKNILNDIKDDIIKEINPDLIEISDEMALIAIVGKNMKNKAGLSGNIFKILGDNNINVKMIAQGPDELNIIVGVDNNDYENTIKTLYDGLIKKYGG